MPVQKPVKCRHCGKNKAVRPRGLCWRCYYTPGVRALYPPTGPRGVSGEKGWQPEPSAAEVEAMVAEQMKNLPSWWWNVECQDRV